LAAQVPSHWSWMAREAVSSEVTGFSVEGLAMMLKV
jgi:hypothetical protein